MPFWNSIDEVTSLTNVLKWIVAVCGVITTTAGIVLIIYSNRKDDLKKIEEDKLKSELIENRILLDKSKESDSLLNLQIEERKVESQQLKDSLSVTKKELSETKLELKDREISPEQKEKFISYLKNAPKGEVNVLSIIGNEESYQFAKQIKNMLIEAGYNVKSANSNFNFSGVGIFIKSIETQPPFAGTIQKALESIDISASGNTDENLSELFSIYVGYK